MQRWEYCQIIRGMGHESVIFYTNGGGHRGGPIKRDKSLGDRDETDAAGRLIATLGVDGWEMVGVSNHGYLQWLYFRRPLP